MKGIAICANQCQSMCELSWVRTDRGHPHESDLLSWMTGAGHDFRHAACESVGRRNSAWVALALRLCWPAPLQDCPCWPQRMLHCARVHCQLTMPQRVFVTPCLVTWAMQQSSSCLCVAHNQGPSSGPALLPSTRWCPGLCTFRPRIVGNAFL